MAWLSFLGGVVKLVLKLLGLYEDNKAEELQRKKELGEAIDELSDKSTESDISRTIDRVNRGL